MKVNHITLEEPEGFYFVQIILFLYWMYILCLVDVYVPFLFKK